MDRALYYKILKRISDKGVVSIQEAVSMIKRKNGDYTDFIPLAILLHANYIETDTTSSQGGEKIKGTLGFNTKDTARSLALVATPQGEHCEIDGFKNPSWSDMDAYVFITANGALKLEEINERQRADEERNTGYRIAILTAILASILSSALTAFISR